MQMFSRGIAIAFMLNAGAALATGDAGAIAAHAPASSTGQHGPADWLVASGTGTCSVTDVDFSDALHGFAAGAFNCGLVSDDGGLNWREIRVVPQQGMSLMWAHADDQSHFWAARNGLFRSDDRGLSWTEIGGLSDLGGSIPSIAFVDAQTLLMDKGGQIQRSSDAGATWELVYPGDFDVAFNQMHVTDAHTAYATGGRGSANTGNVLRSDDDGQNWTLLEFTHGAITAAVFLDSQHGYAATQNLMLFETRDGAQSWQQIGPLPGAMLTDIGFRAPAHLYGAGFDGCLYESLDAGLHWASGYCDPDGSALASLSLRGSAVIAAGNDGLVLYENRIFRDGLESP